MIKEGINGFCMALADSVPGVSGGTVAFIMGFYDRFIRSIHNLVFGKRESKTESLRYLIKLGIGWVIGMISAVLVLSALFEDHIYTVSSLFIGFIAGAIPLIIKEEKDSIRQAAKGMIFCVIGIVVVAGITWLNGQTGSSAMDLSQFSIGLGIKLFLIGMIAISAMFLPGISGSTLLLIFGAYIPVITAVRGFLGLDLSYVPSLMFFGCGVLTGAVTVVKIIKVCLENYRPQTIYMILGMMIGSFYAIVMGPTTLHVQQAPLGLGNFQLIAMIVGLALVLGMQWFKERSEKHGD
jgi:putative membrane protein